MMKVQILKGTDEIGGSCIKLQTNNTTILLDYGTPLKENSKQVKFPKGVDAVLISHPHQDHFGEIKNIDKNIPIFCGKATKEIIKTTAIFTGKELPANDFKTFKPWQSFEIRDIKITPYLVDHSAVDAYAFLVEVDGKKVLYGGDFRANGRKSKLFYQMIEDSCLKNVDILFLEGTMIKRSNEEFIDEKSVEEKIYQTIKENNQISFLISSSQNIGRIVSAYRASKRAGKI